MPNFDFTGALDRAIERAHSTDSPAVALRMSKRRNGQLAAVLKKRGLDIVAGYRGLPIHTAFDHQQTVAIIDSNGKAHLA